MKVQFASRDLREWGASFVANVARDGLVLWARGALPDTLRSMDRRAAASTTAG